MARAVMARGLTAWLNAGLTTFVHLVVLGGVAALMLATLPTLAMGPRDPFGSPSTLRVTPPEANTAPAEATSFGLAGVRLGSTPAALIDGRWVLLGHSVRGARLHSLSPQAVVLAHPDGRHERLLMFPPVATPLPDAPPPAAAPAADQK